MQSILTKATERGLVKLEFHLWSAWLQDPCSLSEGGNYNGHKSEQRGNTLAPPAKK